MTALAQLFTLQAANFASTTVCGRKVMETGGPHQQTATPHLPGLAQCFQGARCRLEALRSLQLQVPRESLCLKAKRESDRESLIKPA